MRLSHCSREICKSCFHINAVGFSVPDEVWKSAVPEQLQNRILCLGCFTRLADEKLIPWDDCIEFWPVSLATHIADELKDAITRPIPCHAAESQGRDSNPQPSHGTGS